MFQFQCFAPPLGPPPSLLTRSGLLGEPDRSGLLWELDRRGLLGWAKVCKCAFASAERIEPETSARETPSRGSSLGVGVVPSGALFGLLLEALTVGVSRGGAPSGASLLDSFSGSSQGVGRFLRGESFTGSPKCGGVLHQKPRSDSLWGPQRGGGVTPRGLTGGSWLHKMPGKIPVRCLHLGASRGMQAVEGCPGRGGCSAA